MKNLKILTYGCQMNVAESERMAGQLQKIGYTLTEEIDPTPYELKEVSAVTNVELDFLRSVLDDEERSHIDVEDESIMILTNVPVIYDEESYDTLPLSTILTKNYVITVCLEETPVFSSFNERTVRLFRRMF